MPNDALAAQNATPPRVPLMTTSVTGVDPDALVEFTRELVRIPSVYDPERGLSEAPAAELVEAQMRAFGWEPRLDTVADGRTRRLLSAHGPHRRLGDCRTA
jgi:succinyl-diaminopimelate desuccinylase